MLWDFSFQLINNYFHDHLNDIIFAIILAFTFAVLFWILSLFVDYSVKGKKAKKKFIEFYKKYDEIKQYRINRA